MMSILLLGSGSANAGNIKPDGFFDFGYAKQLWLASPTRDEMERLYECPKLDDEVFDAWEKSLGQNSQKALESLKSHPSADLIKQCYDTRLTYEVWDEAYGAWRNDLFTFGSGGWNSGKPCKIMVRTYNIFTGKCDDLSDWRSPRNAAEDEKWMSQGNARGWSKWNKKTAE